MEISSTLLQLWIILIPGLIAIQLMSYMTEVGKFGKYEWFFGALISSWLIFMIYSIVAWIFCIQQPIKITLGQSGYFIDNITPFNIFIVFIIIIVYSIGLVVIYEKDLILKLTNKARFTNKLSGTVWEKSLKRYKDNWVRVYLERNLYVLGWMKYFSTGDEKPALFLRKTRYFRVSDDMKEVEEIFVKTNTKGKIRGGILIIKDIKRIEIADVDDESNGNGVLPKEGEEGHAG